MESASELTSSMSMEMEYVDYINSWGPQILGHAFKPVISAIKDTADNVRRCWHLLKLK